MRALVPLTALFASSLLACGELPGEIVGTYKIGMTIEENTCGEGAVNLLHGHRYAAELRSDGKRGYWRVPSAPPLEGEYDAPKFRFESSAIVANEGADAGPRGCTLRQVDVLTGEVSKLPDAGSEPHAEGDEEDAEENDDEESYPDALDAGPDASDAGLDAEQDAGDDLALRGQHTFTISAVAGTDCTAAFAPRGRFEKLPCTLRYSVRGVDTKPF